jgi:hypothetical protein
MSMVVVANRSPKAPKVLNKIGSSVGIMHVECIARKDAFHAPLIQNVCPLL